MQKPFIINLNKIIYILKFVKVRSKIVFPYFFILILLTTVLNFSQNNYYRARLIKKSFCLNNFITGSDNIAIYINCIQNMHLIS